MTKTIPPASAGVFLLCLALGCGDFNPDKEADSNNHGYGYGYDAIGASGLRIRYNDGMTTMPANNLSGSDIKIDILEIAEVSYLATERCIKTYDVKVPANTPMPLVIMLPVGLLAPYFGTTYEDTNTIALEDHQNGSLFWIMAQHEYTHYILLKSGLSKERSRAHNHPLFAICGPTP